MSELSYELGGAATIPDFANFTQNIRSLYNMFVNGKDPLSDEEEVKEQKPVKPQTFYPVDKKLLEVRKAVCIAGYNRDAIISVKKQVTSVLGKPYPIESLHVKVPEDAKDGAFLVPKVILVASHTPGRKLIAEGDDDGILDELYDEAMEVGADIMIVYVGLPTALYQPMKHILYHPRLMDLVFPQQKMVRRIAHENCLVTCCQGCEFTSMQKNMLKEWIEKPVSRSHPVYQAASKLSAKLSSPPRRLADEDDIENWTIQSVPAHVFRSGPAVLDTASASAHALEYEDLDFTAATEEHPIIDKKRKRHEKARKSLMKLKRKLSKSEQKKEKYRPVEDLQEDVVDGTEMELNMYRHNLEGSGQFSVYLT